MTKHDLAIQLAQSINSQDFGVAAATHVIDNLMQIATDAMLRGESIYLRGFASIKPVIRKARKARNINADTVIQLPPCKIVKLIPSPALIKKLN